MSGKQTVFKTMNKGSWRMLQDCTIYATVHRLNKAKNNKTKDGSPISICEGQLHLAGAYTQGQKKAQRCFILFVPCIFHIQLISECFAANVVCVPFSKEREKDLSSHKTQEPSYVILSGKLQCPLSPHMLSKRRPPASLRVSLWLLLLHIAPGTNFTSHGTVWLKLRISECRMEIDSADF